MKYVFIGTSRIAAAILVDFMKEEGDKECYINAGRGYSTAVIQNLGLRDLARRKHGNLNGTIIFVESPGGNCLYTGDHQRSMWVDKRSPQLIIPFLDKKTLMDFWRYSDNTFLTKTNVTVLYFSRCYLYSCFIKEVLSRNSFNDLLVKTGIVKDDRAPSTLTVQGGIKTDENSIEENKNRSLEYFTEVKNSMKLIDDKSLSASEFSEMVEFSRKYHAQIVAFGIPLTTIQKATYGCSVAEENARKFKTWLYSRNIKYFQINFKTSDSDFPDLWHLSVYKAAEYTRVLADSLSVATL